MIKMNGCELGSKVKELNNDIDIILVTAHENIENNTSNFEVLSKPLQYKYYSRKLMTI
jgi:two-component SAPR family response regulator